jgi:hypothetical protein
VFSVTSSLSGCHPSNPGPKTKFTECPETNFTIRPSKLAAIIYCHPLLINRSKSPYHLMLHCLYCSRTSLNNRNFNLNTHVPYSYALFAVSFPVNIHPYVVNSYWNYKIGLASFLNAVTSGSCLWLSRQPITGPEIGTRVAELCTAHSVM